ncbi:AMP-dependent synthetase and ligase [Neobacillus bataviensis LMG 21833]|uniref:AMP-dependent synthetase and ligase n=1 Tax=Neobacillus bataviensis LMG 21833 TaxID=1117379 RepID=K6CHN1_9BACI|nr:class I adenylate-forming enzyme family protein [Neobacillus bataviensis]EKN70640.1 AMP-dependent synthetase and ligase [Neobacillus bataviensis LMG 21833]
MTFINFFETLKKQAEERPDQSAFIFMDESITWKQYHDTVNSVANSIIRIGLKPGDSIATILPQSPAFMYVYMAAAKLGLVIVPLDPRLNALEMIALCKRIKPKLLITIATTERIKENVNTLLKEVDINHVYSYFGDLIIECALPFESLIEFSSDHASYLYEPSLDDPLLIIFTSGSTGKPKGAVITHKNIFSICKTTIHSWGITNQDRMLINLPNSHVGGLTNSIGVQLLAGASAVLVPAFNPEETLHLIQKYKITVTGGVPTMYRIMFRSCSVRNFDVSSIRVLRVSGEPSSAELINEIKRNFVNVTIATSWGMTETSGFFTFTKPNDDINIVANTVGAPGDGYQMKILKTNDTWAQTAEIGEILVKGDSVISGYLNEEDNKNSFYNGWLKTGDLGYLDENNYLHFAGRLKEMYISGGYNVYPLEIESFLNKYPGVSASVIIAIPDEIWGEVGCAFIIPHDNTNLDIESLKEYCKKGLADYKQPKKFIIERNLPKTAIGKIAKQEIKRYLEKYID